MKPIYLDYNATTPIDPRVRDSMLPYLGEMFGNPASVSHAYGWEADAAVKKARKQVADLIGCEPFEIIFTSGATESNNLAIQGCVYPQLMKREPVHIITTATEHKCVLEIFNAMGNMGAEITILKPDSEGRVHAADVMAAVKPHTRLVSIIHAQNEIGSLNDLKAIGAELKKQNIPFHSDAAQSIGKMPVDVKNMNVDMFSASAQKMYGPKGIGFLYIRKDHPTLNIQPVLFGGAQERGLRPGTLNVAGIVGLGKACEICIEEMSKDAEKTAAFQKRLINEVLSLSKDIKLNGSKSNRIYSNVSFTFKNLSSDLFSLGLSGMACSTSSACSGGATSHVLCAIGHSDAEARSTIRLGMGRFTTDADINFAIDKIKQLIAKNNSLLGS